MTQEEKQLLLTDLSARLPYNLSVEIEGVEAKPLGCNKVININIRGNWVYISSIPTEIEIDLIKPYLRPMSSMTEDETMEYHRLRSNSRISGEFTLFVDWLNAKYFDYRKLIEKGLALEAPKGMY